ncbi:MAG TPA: TonB family protein [Edaphobacter sp.]
MTQLAEDRKFAMDFWALAGRFSSREGGPLSDDQVLHVIVHEIAGCEAAAVNGTLKQPIDLLARMLAGEDVQSPVVQHDAAEDVFPPPVEPAPPVQKFPTPPLVETQPLQKFSAMLSAESAPGKKFVEPLPLLDQTRRPFEPDPMPSPLPEPEVRAKNRREEHDPDHAVLTQHQLDEALLRLELSGLELKLHLDNIDSRMSRMEPHLEELASKVWTARENVNRRPAEPETVREPVRLQVPENQRHIQESVGRAFEKSRLVLEPQSSPTNQAAIDDDDPSIPIPLESYSQRRFSPSVGLFAALLLVGLAGFFFLHRQYGASMWADFGPSLRERYDAALHELHDVVKGHPSDESVSAESDSVPPTAETQAASVPNAAPQTPPQATKAAPQPQAIHAAPEPSLKHKNHPAPAPVERELASSGSAYAVGNSEAPVSVAPAVMEENLVVSRVPAYPDAAKADHVEGPVVMQAIITKNGTVGHLHVIQGDPLLRSAASEAVSKWRYRPYTVNGRPVEAATTVTVDFKLNR